VTPYTATGKPERDPARITRDVATYFTPRVESIPEGADVHRLARGGKQVYVGKTPLVMRFAIGGMAEIELTAPSHLPLRTQLYETDGRFNQFVLERREKGSFTLNEKITVPPAIDEDLILIASDSGVVTAYDVHSLQPRWALRRGGIHRLLGNPLITPEGIYLVWNDRQVFLRAGSPMRAEHLARVAFRDAEHAFVADGLDGGERIVITNLATVTDGIELRLEQDAGGSR